MLFCCLAVAALSVFAGCGSSSSANLPTGTSAGAESFSAVGHSEWASSVATAGCPNMYRVGSGLYRGGKPSSEGFRQLKGMGVKTVVDLGHWFFEVDNLNDPQLAYRHIDFYTWAPQDYQVVEFLRIATDPAQGPVYVHCRRGADRTGFMVAIYRVVVDGWSREAAIAEMTGGGFGFDSTYQNLVSYIRSSDLPALARQAGIQPHAPVVSAGTM